MADKITDLFDAKIKGVLQRAETQIQKKNLREQLATDRAADPNYGDDALLNSTPQDAIYQQASSHLADLQSQSDSRNLGEHLQDMGVGVMGTLGSIGGTADLAANAIADSLENFGQYNRDPNAESHWDRTAGALERMNDTGDYWNSLQTEKSKGFDRISQYRQERALEQANAESQAATGHDAGLVERLMAGFGTGVDNYLEDPGHILTDGVAQLPYLLTGGVAKGVVEGTKLANPLIAQLTRKMSVESAEKLVEMGIVGTSQGAIEGSSAAAQTYARVMASTDTFGPGQEAEREQAALHAAWETFKLSGAVSTVTGTLASKFELSPFAAKGESALARTGDNIIKGLQEGIQETIESGNSQFASNLYGNEVLKGKDLVSLDQGVGAAAGQGFVVGMGSTAVTNPRSMVDAAIAPLTLAGSAVSYVGDKAAIKERRADMSAAVSTADEIVANATTPAIAAAMQAGVQQPTLDATGAEQTVDTPAENVVLPAEVDTRNQVSLFATGMEYLKGSADTVDAFHVLGAVLASANNIQSLRDAAKQDAADESLSPEDRDNAKTKLTQLNSIINNDQLDKWVADFPMEDIESELEDLKQTPENFGAVVAHLAARNPLKMTDKIVVGALEAKRLPKEQRDSLLLAQELLKAEAELKVSGKPTSDEVTRSMMQTGFPGSKENDSVAGYISQVTTALAQGDQYSAQIAFHRLVKFANFEQDRAAAYEAAKKAMAADPDSKRIELNGYYQIGEHGKLDKTLPQFVDKKALGLVDVVRNDANAISKMVTAIQKRTGLTAVAPAAAPVATPAAAPVAPAPVAPTESKKAVEAPVTGLSAAPASEQEENDLANVSDESLAQELDTLTESIRRRRNNDTGKAVEQDTRFNNLVREQARRMQTAPKKAVDKPVEKAAPAKAEPAAVPVDIAVEEPTTNSSEIDNEVVDAPAVVEEPSRNHFSDLQPSYPVAEGASVAEQHDAKNHLSQSFSTSDRTGLVSKLPKSVSDFLSAMGLVANEDVEVGQKIFGFKDRLVNRLQSGIAEKFPKTKRMAMLKGQNFWKEANGHSLYATAWNEAGIAYDKTIADVMAWTGVQQLLDMVNPVSWSADKQAAFLRTYGDAILPKLQQGWVPLSDQVVQVAQKLQTNLELTPDNTVSLEYTEGTMLSLAMDTLSTLMGTNGDLEVEQVATLKGPLVQWVRVTTDPDLLHAAARAVEGFFPERASTAAGIVGTKPDKVNPFYRGSRQKVGKEQRKALLKMSQTEHKLSPLLSKLWAAMPNEAIERLFGYDHSLDQKLKAEGRKAESLDEIARDGANRTLSGDLKTIGAHIRAVIEHASQQEEETDITDVPSYFEYEMVVNGRAMTKGTSPQSSKAYRELFSTVQRTVDPSQNNRGFLMAVAQGFGVKMDKQPVQTSLAELEGLLQKPAVQAALAAAERFGKGDMSQLENDLAAFENSGIEMTPHALSAFIHMAAYQKGQPFTSSLSYEIDGLTDGPINLMMLLGLKGNASQMEHWLGLGGLWFDETKTAVQDKLDVLKDWFGGSKDLYEIIAARASELNTEQAQALLQSVPADQQKSTKRMLQAILHLMHITKLSESNLQTLAAKHSRSFTKKPTQAAGYQQGPLSIVNDLANSLTEALSERIDAGKMTDGDWAAVDMLFSNKLIYSKDKKQYFLKANPDEFVGLKWEGNPLNRAQFKGLVQNLTMFGGHGLANATLETIGYQRNRMSDAVNLVNGHIRYAQSMLEKAYKAKQDEEVAAGRLHENQALSKKDEQTLIAQVWGSIIPHPMLRNTGGLPSASTSRSGVPAQNVRRVQSALFDRQNMQVSEASFEDPGVSFAALSIMAAGDGSMMTGFFANVVGNFLNMFDGIYIDPTDIDMVGEAINKEVKQNWEHDYIGAVLNSLKMQDEGFRAWAETQDVTETGTLLDELEVSEQNLLAQQQQQSSVMKDINARDHWVSHMAGHDNPFGQTAVALNSDQLGTSKTDPLLDIALDAYGETNNGVRTLSKAEVISLLNQHTFENPVLSGLWKVLSPLISDDLRLYVTSDRQAMADFYRQNERESMSIDADGTAIGDRVYIRAVNSETFMHELLHYTTKHLVATFYRQPSLLTSQQRTAMKNLESLMVDFLSKRSGDMDGDGAMWVHHAQVVVQSYLERGNYYAAMEEFLAYGLTNYHLQRALNATQVKTPLLESIFQAVKKLFGFPAGTKSDSMLAAMFSNFSALTLQAEDTVYPVMPEQALNSINPDLARSFGGVLQRLVEASALRTVMLDSLGKAGPATARYAAKQPTRDRLTAINTEARTRMQELADSNLFPTMTNDQQTAGEYIQAMFAAGLQFKSTENALLARVVDAVREAGPKIWRSNNDPSDQTDIDLAQARFDFFFENTASTHDRVADILSMSLVNPEFAERMNSTILPQQALNKSTLNNWLDSLAKMVYDKMDTGLALNRDATLRDALEVAALRMQKSMLQSVKRQETKPGAYRRATDKLSEGVHLIGEKAGKTAEARLKLKANKDWISSSLIAVAGVTNTRYADQLGNLVLSLSNQLEGSNPGREIIQETVGTVGDNFKLIQLKGIAARMVSAIRQTFREQVPVTVRSWFKDLTPEQDGLLHMVIGKMALYSLSQDMKDRLPEILANPNAALLDAQMTLMNSGDRSKRLLMIKYAKHLGDRMANRGNQALYLNTRAIAGLAVHGGGDALTATEMAALENLSTLQALSHLTTTQRRSVQALQRDNTEGFQKTMVLIHAYHQFDTQRAGQNTATMNFQKGWIPVEADGRKKVKLFQKSEVRKAERMGWVQVGEFKDDPSLVYMATTIGKTPTLSGGAIHAVDMHMNGIHFHSGMPTDPSIQTTITNPKQMVEIQGRILNGEVMPYTALYDAAGDVVGFQRSLDQAVVERHTKTIGRISEAAGIWLGRLHEERVAHGQNQAAANLLRQTWDQGQVDKREKEFVNIRQPYDPASKGHQKVDKVIKNVWETLPYHTKRQLENAFADGSKNPPIWVRRDQLNDAIGYHKASVSNFYTGDNRFDTRTSNNVAALSRQMLGKNAYKYLVTAEEGWQSLISSAKDTIIVKSLTVALNNLASNQIQLFMITGNPVWNLRVQSQKHKELVSYLGYQQRIARLTAEGLATHDPKAKARIDAEQAFLQNEKRKLSIYPLIEAGEMPTIQGEGLSESEEFSLAGDFTEWAEKQLGKMPPALSTVVHNLAVSKETSLYKGLDRMVQYGDFVAKAAMYEWLTTQDKSAAKDAFDLHAADTSGKLTVREALHQVALKEINDEFVNYSRLPGRYRTYGEDMGLTWFFNYKLRIMKMMFRRARKNPAAFLIGSQVGGLLGLATVADVGPWDWNMAYSVGPDPLFSAHETIFWNQML